MAYGNFSQWIPINHGAGFRVGRFDFRKGGRPILRWHRRWLVIVPSFSYPDADALADRLNAA